MTTSGVVGSIMPGQTLCTSTLNCGVFRSKKSEVSPHLVTYKLFSGCHLLLCMLQWSLRRKSLFILSSSIPMLLALTRTSSMFLFSRVADSGLATRIAERVLELPRLPHWPSLVWWGLVDWGGREATFLRVCYRRKRVWKPATNKNLTKNETGK